MVFDVQKLVDVLSDQSRRERSIYHLTLGKLMETVRRPELSEYQVLASLDDGGLYGIHKPHSYRGYYSDLAFDTGCPPKRAGKFAEWAEKKIVGKIFEGYKGGDYEMDDDTPLWISTYGECYDIAIVGIEIDNDEERIILQTKNLS